MTPTRRRTTPKQDGFTLVELVCVIVILGILAATALPKFVDLGSNARKAAVHTAGGALAAVSVMTHSKWLVSSSSSAPVNMEGVAVAMVLGYPSSAATTATAAGLNADDWTIRVNGRDLIVSPKSAAVASTCKATYSEATADTGALVPSAVAVVDGGC